MIVHTPTCLTCTCAGRSAEQDAADEERLRLFHSFWHAHLNMMGLLANDEAHEEGWFDDVEGEFDGEEYEMYGDGDGPDGMNYHNFFDDVDDIEDYDQQGGAADQEYDDVDDHEASYEDANEGADGDDPAGDHDFDQEVDEGCDDQDYDEGGHDDHQQYDDQEDNHHDLTLS